MNQNEIEKLKADIKFDKRDYKAANAITGPFSAVRNEYKEKLYKAYGTVWYGQVWDNIRKLSCSMAGVRYVRDLTPSLEIKAAEYAKTLCKMAVKEDAL